MQRRNLALLWIVSLLGASGVLRAEPPSDVAQPRYVAMGSSFAAGPGVATRADPGPAPCMRSSANYAHLLAQRRGLALTDVSCGGATTADVLHGGQFGLGAQLDAVTADTQLVTVTIGGNDVFYIGTLGAMACQKQAAVPDEQRLKYCTVPSPAKTAQAFAGLAQHLREIVVGVHERAPRARVIFVGYQRILPVHGTCANLALTAAEADRVRAIARKIDAATARAARAEGADFVPMSTLSQGHDACSADPWINGFLTPAPGAFGPAPFHPNAAGMAAIAERLDRLLSPGGS